MAIGDLITTYMQYEFNGMLIGSGTDFITTKVEGLLGGAEVKTTDFDRNDAWGEYPGRDMFKGKKITFTVDVIGTPDPAAANPIQTNYDNLTAAIALPDVFPPASPGILVFYRPWVVAGKRFYYVRPGKNAVVSDSEFATGHFQIVFEMKCNDPRSYSLAQHLDALTIANTTTSVSQTVTNNGNSASAPLLVINGPSNSPIIANANDSNKSLQVTLNLGATDALTIDMKQRTILLNGSTDVSYLMTLGSKFWKLQPGGNVITYNRSNAGAASLMNLYHYDVWSS